MARIDTKRGREALAPRREPYWQKLSKGRYLGIRKLPSGHAAWIARYRDDEGTQHYNALGEVIGAKAMPRTEVTKKLWAYIKKNSLQDKKNKRMIKADDKLKAVFGGKAQVNMFEMTKLVSKHVK